MTARRASIGRARAGPNGQALSIRSAATRARPSRQSCSLSSSSTPMTSLLPRPSNKPSDALRGTRVFRRKAEGTSCPPHFPQRLKGGPTLFRDQGWPGVGQRHRDGFPLESVRPHRRTHNPMLSRSYHREPGTQPDGRALRHHLELVVLQPKSRGWVRLADSDPTSMPLINPNFIGEEEDLRAVVESVRAIRKVMAQESLAPVIEEDMEPGQSIQSDAEIGEW